MRVRARCWSRRPLPRSDHDGMPRAEVELLALARNFNRGATDCFVHGRRVDIGAFDTPKHAGQDIGRVLRVGPDHFDVQAADASIALNNGDALSWWDLQGELQGVPVNVVQALGGAGWRLFPNAPVATLKDLRRGATISRNRDRAWGRVLEKQSAERLIGVRLRWTDTADGFALEAEDDDGHAARAAVPHAHEPARERDFARLPRALPVEPPAPYPEDTLSYLANVFNAKAAAF